MSRSVQRLVHGRFFSGNQNFPIISSATSQRTGISRRINNLQPVITSTTLTRFIHTNFPAHSYLVPIVVEQTGRGERSYDIYSRLLKGTFV